MEVSRLLGAVELEALGLLKAPPVRMLVTSLQLRLPGCSSFCFMGERVQARGEELG